MPPPRPTAAILWLHSLEDNPADFAGIVAPHVPWIHVNTPTADVRQVGCRTKPLPAWFDLNELPVRAASLEAAAIGGAQPDGLHESVKIVHERLDYLMDTMGIDGSRLLLGGVHGVHRGAPGEGPQKK